MAGICASVVVLVGTSVVVVVGAAVVVVVVGTSVVVVVGASVVVVVGASQLACHLKPQICKPECQYVPGPQFRTIALKAPVGCPFRHS